MKKYYSFLLLLCVITFVLAVKYTPNVDSHGFWLGKTRGDLRALESAVNLFKLGNGRVPRDTEGLWILVDINEDTNLPNWKKYMDRLPKDYWGNEYVYNRKIKEGGEFVIYSKGPDGLDAKGLEDDVVLWEKEYDCEIYNDCYSFKDHVGYVSVSIALLSFFLVLAGIVFQISRYIYRKIKDNHAINSTR